MTEPQVPIDVDKDTGVWTTDGLPMIYVPQHFFVNNHMAVEAALGIDKYREILDTAGYQSAYYWCKKEAATHDFRGVRVYGHYLKRLSQRGWGLFTLEAIDPKAGIARIRLDHSVFVQQYGTSVGRRVCYMFCGWFCGAMEWVAENAGRSLKVVCREIHCACEGERDHCVFEVKPR